MVMASADKLLYINFNFRREKKSEACEVTALYRCDDRRGNCFCGQSMR